MRNIIFKKINFLDIEEYEFDKIIKKNGLFVFPSGPGLSTITRDKIYLKSLINSDYVFFDSGYFVLILKLFKNINVKKVSGYKFLKFFFHYIKKKNIKLLLINPSLNFSASNQKFLYKLGIKKKNIINYIAPIYNKKKIKDFKIIKIIKSNKPDYIMINLGSNIQEPLGDFINKKTKKKFKILCTGAAISFFTGDQAPIGKIIDKFYLGWIVRIIFNPSLYFKRYLSAFYLLIIVLKNKIKTK